MAVYLLDKSVKVEIYYEEKDCSFEDNICASFLERCPEDEKIFRAIETNIYLTAKQARQLAKQLLAAAETSERACEDLEKGEL
jgi:hypothetical protein